MRSALAVLVSGAAIAHAADCGIESGARDICKRIDNMVRAEYAKDHRGGVTTAIVQHGEVVWTASYGFADEATHRRASRATIYPVGSVSKIATGLMLLQLVQKGRVHLADPVERYVSDVRGIANPFPWAPPITLVQLATMTAGITNLPPDPPDTSVPWERQLLAVLPRCAVRFEPGTRREYSNVSYLLLALALERAAGESYDAYVKREILDALGMTDSGFVATSLPRSRVATGYFLGRSGAPGVYPENSLTDILLPAGDLLSTVDDLAKLMRFQMGGGPDRVLSKSALEDSYRLVVPSDAYLQYGDGIGYSAVRNPDGSMAALGHGGLRNTGVFASYEFDAASKTGMILLANTSYGKAKYKPMVRRILELIHPRSPGGSGLPVLEEH